MGAIQGFPSLTIANGGTALAIVPALGAKIASMRLGGREWLWTSDALPYRAPVDGASYVETADSGGFDECFPTVGPCTIHDRSLGTLSLPDHGELWAIAPAIEHDAHRLRARWEGRRMRYRFEREIAIGDRGEVEMRYAATNTGDRAMPFLWSSHPLLPLGPSTRLHLPEGARVRVDAQHGIDLGGRGAEHRWPMIAGHDLRRPASAGSAYACKLFLDLDGAREVAIEEEGGAILSCTMESITHFGLWLNDRGWTPFAAGTPYLNLAFEPCLGAPDSLADAMSPPWSAAEQLAPGEARRWSLSWRAGR